MYIAEQVSDCTATNSELDIHRCNLQYVVCFLVGQDTALSSQFLVENLRNVFFELSLPGKPLEALVETPMKGALGFEQAQRRALGLSFGEAFCSSSGLRTATDG